MKETITAFVGLDIHKDTIAIAVAEAGRAPRFIGTTPRSSRLQSAHALAEPGARRWSTKRARAATAGRDLNAHGCGCEIVAPAKSPRSPAERIKTDRRDALLARESRAGELVSVMMPDARDEAMRDLSRTAKMQWRRACERDCN